MKKFEKSFKCGKRRVYNKYVCDGDMAWIEQRLFVVWTISWSVAGTYREISKGKNGIESGK